MVNAGYWLSTDRLALRRFTPDDYDWLVALYNDPDVMRYGGGVKSPDQVKAVMRERILDYYDAHPGLGVWQTVERVSGTPIGFHVLNNIQGESIIQVGYFLSKPAWGRGYATEMARALLRYGFVELGLSHIAGMAERENVASHRKSGCAGTASARSSTRPTRMRVQWRGSSARLPNGWLSTKESG